MSAWGWIWSNFSLIVEIPEQKWMQMDTDFLSTLSCKHASKNLLMQLFLPVTLSLDPVMKLSWRLANVSTFKIATIIGCKTVTNRCGKEVYFASTWGLQLQTKQIWNVFGICWPFSWCSAKPFELLSWCTFRAGEVAHRADNARECWFRRFHVQQHPNYASKHRKTTFSTGSNCLSKIVGIEWSQTNDYFNSKYCWGFCSWSIDKSFSQHGSFKYTRQASNRRQTVCGPNSQETSALSFTFENALSAQKYIRSSISETVENPATAKLMSANMNEPFLISVILSHPVQEQEHQLSFWPVTRKVTG